MLRLTDNEHGNSSTNKESSATKSPPNAKLVDTFTDKCAMLPTSSKQLYIRLHTHTKRESPLFPIANFTVIHVLFEGVRTNYYAA